MSPRATFLLTLLGVLLVGIPLPLLTRKAERTPAAVAPAESMAEMETTYAAISFTGQPRSIRLRHSGGEWHPGGGTGASLHPDLRRQGSAGKSPAVRP